MQEAVSADAHINEGPVGKGLSHNALQPHARLELIDFQRSSTAQKSRPAFVGGEGGGKPGHIAESHGNLAAFALDAVQAHLGGGVVHHFTLLLVEVVVRRLALRCQLRKSVAHGPLLAFSR